MNNDRLIQKLPHRDPMLMVDRVVGVSHDEIHAILKVDKEMPCFKGHFPDEPIFPGVLMMEALAQAGGLILIHNHSQQELIRFYLAQVQKARFYAPIKPSVDCHLKVSLLRHKKDFYYFTGQCIVNDQLMAEVDWTLFFQMDE